MKKLWHGLLLGLVAAGSSGCWAAAAGAGAEAGYVAAQEDRSVAETMSDQRITATVKSKMLANPDVSGLDINVDTFRGNVTLKGFVESQNQIREAIQVARSVSGVENVQSRLIVE